MGLPAEILPSEGMVYSAKKSTIKENVRNGEVPRIPQIGTEIKDDTCLHIILILQILFNTEIV